MKRHNKTTVLFECQECKKPMPAEAPYYFRRYKKSYYLCLECKDKVWERYREGQ